MVGINGEIVQVFPEPYLTEPELLPEKDDIVLYWDEDLSPTTRGVHFEAVHPMHGVKQEPFPISHLRKKGIVCSITPVEDPPALLAEDAKQEELEEDCLVEDTKQEDLEEKDDFSSYTYSINEVEDESKETTTPSKSKDTTRPSKSTRATSIPYQIATKEVEDEEESTKATNQLDDILKGDKTDSGSDDTSEASTIEEYKGPTATSTPIRPSRKKGLASKINPLTSSPSKVITWAKDLFGKDKSENNDFKSAICVWSGPNKVNSDSRLL